MTVPQCAAGCGSPSPSAVICGGCGGRLRAALVMAASIAPDLDDAIARQLRHGGGGHGGEVPLPYDPAASDAAASLRMVLAGVAGRLTAEDGRLPYRSMGTGPMARWLSGQVPRVAIRQDAGEICHAIRRAVDRCVMVLDGPPERTFAGPCHGCGADLLGVPGQPVVTCGRCGASAELAERRRAMRAQLDDMLGGAAWCARMAGRLGPAVSENTVYSWARRSQLVPHGQLPSGRGGGMAPVYRLGDVIDLAARNRKVRG